MSSIANMLIQIKNAQAVGADSVSLPFSNMRFAVARILEEKGFLAEIEKKMRKTKKAEVEYLNLKLKYDDGIGAIRGVKLVSKPSRRVYGPKSSMRPVKSGYGTAVVSTSKGVMTAKEARSAGVGGEVLFEIW